MTANEIKKGEEHLHDGPYTEWYPNGQKVLEGAYKDGEKEGVWREWYENGKKKSHGIYKKGLRQGDWFWWHDNGQLEVEGFYKDFRPEGVWTYLNKIGREVLVARYDLCDYRQREDVPFEDPDIPF